MTGKGEARDIRDSVFDEIYRIAEEDPNVVFLAADLGAFSLDIFREKLPRQYYNVGIAEQNMVNIAAGLALSGKKVFLYSIAPFATLRCFDQLKVSVSEMNLNVTVVGGGPGFCYGSDGPTHFSLQDVAVIRTLSNFAIYNPCEEASAVAAVQYSYERNGPSYIRVDKGAYEPVYIQGGQSFDMCKVRQGRQAYIITTGTITHHILGILDAAGDRSIGVINLNRIDQVDFSEVRSLVEDVKQLFTVEEHLLCGGIGAMLSERVAQDAREFSIHCIGVHDTRQLSGYGDRAWLYQQVGINDELAMIMARFGSRNCSC